MSVGRTLKWAPSSRIGLGEECMVKLSDVTWASERNKYRVVISDFWHPALTSSLNNSENEHVPKTLLLTFNPGSPLSPFSPGSP